MPVHYVYTEPDKTTLCQGDILQKTEALISHLEQYHKYYADHVDYKYFMVLTQTCDLYRREDGAPKSRYITLAAVRPVEEAVRREAIKKQDKWQREANVIGTRTKDTLTAFLTSLLDNNKEGYFYLHADIGLGIQQNCCAFLPLSVALKVDHYEMCLEAKISQLEGPFQAKLGYHLGHMFNRVGTIEWNDKYPDNKASTEARRILDSTFITLDEMQIKEGIADLRSKGTFDLKSAQEIKDYIVHKKVLPRKQKFQERALSLLTEEITLVDSVRDRIEHALRSDDQLTVAVETLLSEAGIGEEGRVKLSEQLIAKFLERLRKHPSDKDFPDKDKIMRKMLGQLLQDPIISKVMQ